jgi:hypothetical protein
MRHREGSGIDFFTPAGYKKPQSEIEAEAVKRTWILSWERVQFKSKDLQDFCIGDQGDLEDKYMNSIVYFQNGFMVFTPATQELFETYLISLLPKWEERIEFD